MLQKPIGAAPSPIGDFAAIERPADFLDLDRLFAIVRRQWLVVGLGAAIGVVLAIAYLFVVTPRYTATASILIDKGKSKVVDELSGTVLNNDEEILSQVELMYSEKIAQTVVDKLTSEKKQTALDELGNGLLEVDRVGQTYVLNVSYTSPNPAEAAAVAQAYAEAYLTDQLEANYDSTRMASEWLQQRIEELRQKSLQSDLAVQKFRADHGLVAADGSLVSEQQLSEVSTQLIAAQADSAKAKARYERLKEIIDSGNTDAVVPEALDSSLINGLRQKYLLDSQREEEISKRLGPSHAQAVSLRAEMAQYRRLMFEELGRIADSYKNEYQVALAREESLRNSLTSSVGAASAANETQVTLRELQREATTYQTLYQTFLQRYQEAIQQQSFPITEARIITSAAVPFAPSHPRKALILALGFLVGAAGGSLVGAFREYRERFFRTGDQVRDELDLELLGLVPLIATNEIARTSASSSAGNGNGGLLRYVLDHPLSAFAETMRSVKVAAELAIAREGPRIIGVVSILPGEGKSAIAANFAQLLSAQGTECLLIDADLRNPDLTKSVAPRARAGLVEAVVDGQAYQNLLTIDSESHLSFLPAVSDRRIAYSAELLGSPQMAGLLKRCGDEFDVVVIDLPPVAPVVDVRAFASRVDAFVLVIEWGRTSRQAVRSVLRAEPLLTRKCLGVVLNKVNIAKLKYYSHGSSEYYYSRFSKYYRDEGGTGELVDTAPALADIGRDLSEPSRPRETVSGSAKKPN